MLNDYPKFCDENCNECELIRSKNSRQLSLVMNSLAKTFFGAEEIINSLCPNLTCCADCHIDEFTHMEDCEIDNVAREVAKDWLCENNDE